MPDRPLVVAVVALGALVVGQSVAPASAAPSAAVDLHCQVFDHPLEGGRVETGDATSEIGQWVAARRVEGWALDGVDFEVAQKSSGFARGLVQVCMRR